jgi:hypothetical protein
MGSKKSKSKNNPLHPSGASIQPFASSPIDQPIQEASKPTLETMHPDCEESTLVELGEHMMDDIPFALTTNDSKVLYRHDSKAASVLGDTGYQRDEPDNSSLYSIYDDPPGK